MFAAPQLRHQEARCREVPQMQSPATQMTVAPNSASRAVRARDCSAARVTTIRRPESGFPDSASG